MRSSPGNESLSQDLRVLVICLVWTRATASKKAVAASDVLKIFSFRSREMVDNFSSICLLAELRSNFLGRFSIA